MITLGLLQRVPCRIAWYHTMSTYEPSEQVWKRRLLRCGKRLVYRAATHVVAVSNACRDDAMRVYGVPDTKCHVFRNCISDPLTEPRYLDLEKQRGTIVCVGNLRISKGQHVLIRAFALLKEKGIKPLRLVLVGDGPAMAEFRTLARDLGVEQACEFAGYQPRQHVVELLARAAVSVLPSSSEGLPYVNIESFAVGTPVVASRVGGIPEIIRDGVDGFLVPPGDPVAIADRLQVLLSDDDLRTRMGQHARHRFLTAFEERHNVDRQASWLQEIVALATGRA
jgi:glycosyltransferase involved in cell wall biosynthesis